MCRIMVAGIGTDVGKTVVSAILTQLLQGSYWKPIQCGEASDAETVRQWVSNAVIHPPAYSFKAPYSPHYAALLENVHIKTLIPPSTPRPLVIEGVGGILVPITHESTTLDLFSRWNCKWIIVSRHYLGSINHTLLTIEMLKQRGVPISGVIFNGHPHLENEAAILNLSQIPFLARLFPECGINQQTITRYTHEWKPLRDKLLSHLAPLHPNEDSASTNYDCSRKGILPLRPRRQLLP